MAALAACVNANPSLRVAIAAAADDDVHQTSLTSQLPWGPRNYAPGASMRRLPMARQKSTRPLMARQKSTVVFGKAKTMKQLIFLRIVQFFLVVVFLVRLKVEILSILLSNL